MVALLRIHSRKAMAFVVPCIAFALWLFTIALTHAGETQKPLRNSAQSRLESTELPSIQTALAEIDSMLVRDRYLGKNGTEHFLNDARERLNQNFTGLQSRLSQISEDSLKTQIKWAQKLAAESGNIGLYTKLESILNAERSPHETLTRVLNQESQNQLIDRLRTEITQAGSVQKFLSAEKAKLMTRSWEVVKNPVWWIAVLIVIPLPAAFPISLFALIAIFIPGVH